MKDFIIRNDTKLLFRNDPLDDLTNILKNKKVLLVYGGGSIRENGCYNDINQAASRGSAEIIEFGNASNKIGDIEKGIELSKEKKIEMIIGAGGATVMDAAKFISFGHYHADYKQYIRGKNTAGMGRLPLILIPTYPSSGTELGTYSVVFNPDTKEFGAICGITADYAILVPRYSLTLSPELTTYTCLVTLVQLSICILGDKNPISYDQGISVIKNVIKSFHFLKENPNHLKARGEILYAASMTNSDWLSLGKVVDYGFDIYEIEFIVANLFGTTYRKNLTTIFPRFLKAISKYHEEDVRLYFKEVFNFEGSIDDSVNKVIQFFTKQGADMYFEGNLSREKFSEIPNKASLTEDEVFDIIKNSMK